MTLYDCLLLVNPHVRKEMIMDLVGRIGKHIYQRKGVITNLKSFGTGQLGYDIKKLGGRHYRTLEYVCEEYGGRVKLAKDYYDGLTKSLVKIFKGTGMISSMQQCNDFFFLGTSQISFGRAGDDFWFQDPNGDPLGVYWLQRVHIIHCAYNSLWMGQMIQPDWDMFKSDHCCAKYHASSRAICGGPVYLSDSVGCHNFDLIRQLVFPDGIIPKCFHFALPTRDCLFMNPLFDGETILKIWNLNKIMELGATTN